MAFQITPPHALTEKAVEAGGLTGGVLGGAVRRDALGELREAFAAAAEQRGGAAVDVL